MTHIVEKACEKFCTRMIEQGVDPDLVKILRAGFHAGFMGGMWHALTCVHTAYDTVSAEMRSTADTEITTLLSRMEGTKQ